MKDFYRFISATVVLLLFLLPVSVLAIDSASKPFLGERPSDPPMILDTGGPDAYGYYYIDSNDEAVNAPEFNWIDISGYGVDMGIVTDDANVGPFPIGFTFNSYGVDYISFRANSNGWASFSSTVPGYSNQSIPDPGEPNDLLAVYWDDLHPRNNGHAYYYSNDADTCIIAWHDFERFSGEGFYTFEIILTADGNILYQYQSLTGVLDSHTIGIENSFGTIGLEYIFDSQRDETGTAILFTLEPPDYGELDVLLVAADGLSDFAGLLEAYQDIGQVDYYDARVGNPTLQQLQEYDVAVVYSNNSFADPMGLGDILADYLDGGGGVVLYAGSFSSGYELQGRIMTDYSPFSVGQPEYQDRNLGSNDAGHQIMAGVYQYTDGIVSLVSLTNSPILVASYDTGTPLVAYNPENNLVAVNGFIGLNSQYSGDVIQLGHNAVVYAVSGQAEILLMQGGTGGDMAKADLLGFNDISSVHIYDPTVSSPALDLLQLYETVIAWSDAQFDDATLVGNRLADYVDMGGGAILGQFCFGSGWNLEGRIMDSYSPYGPGEIMYSERTLGWYDADHPLMMDVTDVTEFYAAEVTMENDGVSVASWDDSTPFVAYSPDHDVVGINGYIGDNRQFTGDMMVIYHNAINFLRGQTAVDDDLVDLPNAFGLSQNYPNPFNPSTIIEFNLPSTSAVKLVVFNVLGQKVTTLADEVLQAGVHSITFDASRFGSGMYFYRLDAGEFSLTKKMTILK